MRGDFRAAHGTESVRDLLVVRLRTDAGDGWGECGAGTAPTYAPEFTAGAHLVVRDHLAPRLLAATAGPLHAADVATALAGVDGHHMAKAALEMAVLDAELRAEGRSLASH